MKKELLLIVTFLSLVVLSGVLILNSLKKIVTEANVSVTTAYDIQ